MVPSPAIASITLSLEPVLKATTAAGYARLEALWDGFYGLSHLALEDLGPAELQPLLQVVEIADLYTTVHQPLQLSPKEEVHRN